MPTLLELQKEIHRIYCLTVYGENNTRKLTKKDREKLELIVAVDEGSSFYDTLLDGVILQTFQDAVNSMRPEQITAVLLVTGLSVTSVFAWKYWLNFRAKEKELEHTVELSRLEKEKMEVVQKAAQQFPIVQEATSGIDNVRTDLLTRLKPEDRLEVNVWEEKEPGPSPMTVDGHMATQVTKKERQTATETIMEDEFLMESAVFSHADEFRVTLQRASDGYVFHADIPHGVLDQQQIEALKNKSWDRKSFSMRILARELRGRLTSAKVVEINTDGN